MKSIKEVKTVVKALRKEFSNLDKPAAELSHNQTLELLARALGHPSWEAMRVTLEDDAEPHGAQSTHAVVEKPAGVRGFLPYYQDAPATGGLPGYRHDNLLVALQYEPARNSFGEDQLYLELSELDDEGNGLDDCQVTIGCHLDVSQRKTEVLTQGAFVKAVAELVQPYLSADLGLRAIGAALRYIEEGDLDRAKHALDALSSRAAPSGTLDEIAVGEYGALQTLSGEAIIGTLEEVKGHAKLDQAYRKRDGTIELEFEGATVIWWDDARTLHNEKGEVLYVTATYSVVPESQVKLVDLSEKLSDTELPKVY